jgi:hypothetical protein
VDGVIGFHIPSPIIYWKTNDGYTVDEHSAWWNFVNPGEVIICTSVESDRRGIPGDSTIC